MKIVNAASKKITASSNLPNMSQTIVGWFQPITIGIVSETIEDYQRFVSIKYINTQGVVQPYKPEPLEIEKAGVNSWEWQMIHCLPDLILRDDDIIVYHNKRYKVLFKKDYSEYGYVDYTVCETFTTGDNDGMA